MKHLKLFEGFQNICVTYNFYGHDLDTVIFSIVDNFDSVMSYLEKTPFYDIIDITENGYYLIDEDDWEDLKGELEINGFGTEFDRYL